MDNQGQNSGNSSPAGAPNTNVPAVQPSGTVTGNDSGDSDEKQGPASAQTVPDSRALVTVPEHAGDTDLIEKEWVIKAKEIVDHTAEDPFAQQEQLGKMKVDYMKKRYNKDIGQAA